MRLAKAALARFQTTSCAPCELPQLLLRWEICACCSLWGLMRLGYCTVRWDLQLSAQRLNTQCTLLPSWSNKSVQTASCKLYLTGAD